MRWRNTSAAAIVILILLGGAVAQAAEATTESSPTRKEKTLLPPPDLKNVSYGPYERNVLDLWKAKSDKPTPLVVFIHGGGFRAGDKSSLSPTLLRRCLDAKISVAAVNYRFSNTAAFPGPMLDCARAIQFMRFKAKDWNIDPTRVAATGSSAGAGTSLWIGFRDDMADPKSDDPVLRQSTRLTCMAPLRAQSTYDPRAIKRIIGGRAHEHPALQLFFGLKDDELDSPRAHKLYEEASAINYLTPDDPPVFLYYDDPNVPLPPDAKPGDGIHHPKFGFYLKEKMDAMKIECIVRLAGDYKGRNPRAQAEVEMVEFFKKHFATK